MRKIEEKIAVFLLWLASFLVLFFLLALIAYIVFRGLPVVSLKFVFYFLRGLEARGGIFPTIVATFYLTILAGLTLSPIAIGGAVCLTKYAKPGHLVKIIRFRADALSTVPSIVFGLFGLAFFVYFFKLGYLMRAGALTLALMVLPLVMRASEEAILDVSRGFREASFGLGATKWQTIRKVVLPAAMCQIVISVMLGRGRAFGETAAFFLTADMAINLPYFPTDPGRTMTVYLLATEGISLDIAFGAVLLLLLFVLLFNFGARFYGRRTLKGGR